jgi:hypothetical protein
MNAVTPRSVFANRLALDVNGQTDPNSTRFGYLSPADASMIFDLSKAAIENPMTSDDFWGDQAGTMSKAVTTATGLTYYDLRAPALNLFPTITPLRNRFARRQRANPGVALNYKTITSLQGSGFNWMGWVPEGVMQYTANPIAVPYVTIGEEDSLTEEAMYAAQGFEDESSMVQLRTLLKLMAKEEAGLLSGNNSLALGTPAAPTLTAPTTGGASLPAATYSVIVVALSQAAYMHATLGGGVPSTTTVSPNGGGTTFVLNGGASMRSANTTQAITLGQGLGMIATPVNGAVAYAWYVGTAGNETLQLISTINSALLTVPLAGARQAATVIAADYSQNTLAYDGFLTTGFKNAAANGSYVVSLPTGVAGTGTAMTSSGYGSVNEIDTMLKTMWDNYRVSPTVIYVNSQEQRSISKLAMTGTGAAPLIRYNIEAGSGGEVNLQGTAGNVISFYFNPYSPDGGSKIPVKIHPNLAPGTIMAICETLPPWYVQNETPAVAEVLTRKDYYTEVWAKVTRRQDYGIYCQSALAIYAPFAVGVLTNIAPTP